MRNKPTRNFNQENQIIISSQETEPFPFDFGNNPSPTLSKDPRVIWLDDGISPETVLPVIQQINDLNYQDELKEKEYSLDDQEYKRKPIKLHLNSPGGCVYSGLGLIGVMQASKTPIHTYTYNMAASMGFLIAISGHMRFTYPHTTYMYHAGSLQTSGHLLDVKESVEESDRLQEKIEQHTSAVTNIPKEKLSEIFSKKKDWYFDSTLALELKCVDVIL